jgi:predicted dehydrogenase
MTDQLRAGLVGAGFIGEVHARAVRAAGAVLAAVAASTQGRSATATERLQAGRAATSAEELVVADDVDVVHICTPNHLHAPLAELALSAGKHVVCEKPLATSAKAARRLAEAASAAGVVTAVPFVYRFYPAVRVARDRVRRGTAGRLQLLHGFYLQDWLSRPEDYNWRVDSAAGGSSRVFGDIGVHWCDLVEFVSGHRITRVAARAQTAYRERGADGSRRRVDTEDAVTVLFATDRGATGSTVLSQVSAGNKNHLRFSLDGETESLAFSQNSPEALWVGGRRENRVLIRGSEGFGRAGDAYSVLPAGHPQGYQECFNAFVRDTYASLNGPEPDGLPTFADGLRAALLTEAVVQAAAKEDWVEVPHEGGLDGE